MSLHVGVATSTWRVILVRKWSDCVDRQHHPLSFLVLSTSLSLLRYRPYCFFSVLIDDNLDLKKAWEERNGIFVHHVDTKTTLQELRERGILTHDSPSVLSSSELTSATSKESSTPVRAATPKTEEPYRNYDLPFDTP